MTHCPIYKSYFWNDIHADISLFGHPETVSVTIKSDERQRATLWHQTRNTLSFLVLVHHEKESFIQSF